MDQVAGSGIDHPVHGSIEKTVSITDNEFFVFFADDPSQLPGGNAVHELRTAAWRFRDEVRRDHQQFLEVAAASGMIGNAAWAAAARGYVALRAYWQRRGEGVRTIDAAGVIDLVKDTCQRTRGVVPDSFDESELHRGPDGTWRGSFSLGSSAVTVRVDATGRLVHWTQSDGE